MTTPAGLVVDPAYIARRLGVLEPDDELLWQLGEVIAEEQGVVAAYLDRSLTVAEYVETGRSACGATWNVQHPDLVSVVSAVAETDPVTHGLTGLYTVTYTAGMVDVATAAQYSDIRRRIIAAVVARPDIGRWAAAAGGPAGARVLTSVSVDGQSVSYRDDASAVTAAGEAPPGGVPPLSSLDRHRNLDALAYQRTDVAPGPWPYSGAWPGTWGY